MVTLDNDYKAAFDFMVLHWFLKAKGLDQPVINRPFVFFQKAKYLGLQTKIWKLTEKRNY